MTTAVDYIGRKFDVLALRGAQPIGEVLLSQTLFDTASSGDICTGVQKLAQRWLLHFLTVQGSMKFWPDIGTEFLTQAQHGFQTETDVIIAFNIAAVLVQQQMLAEEDETWHPEDRLDHAELLDATLLPGQLQLRIAIWSNAGLDRTVILPISTVPLVTGA